MCQMMEAFFVAGAGFQNLASGEDGKGGVETGWGGGWGGDGEGLGRAWVFYTL